jgi:hypothetical protein
VEDFSKLAGYIQQARQNRLAVKDTQPVSKPADEEEEQPKPTQLSLF